MRRIANALLQSVARRNGGVVAFVRLPTAHEGVPPSAKFDFRYCDLMVEVFRTHTGRKPTSLVEVGANFAQHAEYLRRSVPMEASAVVCVEPHPRLAAMIRESTDMKVVEAAIGPTTGTVTLQAVSDSNPNPGISSVLPSVDSSTDLFEVIEVQQLPLAELLHEYARSGVDMLKVDVEGYAYEALSTLEQASTKPVLVQVECERKSLWPGQRLEDEVFGLLRACGYVLCHYELAADAVQSDSMWIHGDSMAERRYRLDRREWEPVDAGGTER